VLFKPNLSRCFIKALVSFTLSNIMLTFLVNQL